MTNAELMQNPDYDETSRIKFSSSILVMSKQMRNLVEQMLELARADNVQCNTVFSSVDFSRLISDATLPFEPIFFEKGLTLHTEIQDGITVNGDPAQLRQVLDILLDNAQNFFCRSDWHADYCYQIQACGLYGVIYPLLQ